MWLFDYILNLFDKDKGIIPKIPGLIEAPIDFRDLPLGAVQELTDMPPEYEIPYQLPVTYQNGDPHCVGHTGATAKGEKERREQHFIDFDPDWLYTECKKVDGMPQLEGTSFNACLKVLQKIGIKRLDRKGNIEDYRIGGYAKIEPLTYENLKHAIYQNGVVLAGFRGSNQGWSRDLKGYIRPSKSGERTWGHAVSLIGYNKDYIIGQNSFGESWGDKGRFYFDKNYMPRWAWVILVDLPNNWKELMGLKEKPKYTFNKNLYYGLVDPDIKALQECLKYEGCFPIEIASIENFGPLTLYSVKRFQQKYHIEPVLGFVGPLTRAKLNELFV